jgi:uncharacterized protein YndB with AHSA1/START domain
MPATPDATTLPNERTVEFTRIIDAPRALVFRIWIEPRHMAQWWGPKGFDNPVCELDARPGGKILIHMRAPGGTLYPMTGEFLEVVEPERLVFMAYAEDLAGKRLLESRTVVTFEDLGSQTKLTVRAHAVGLVPIAPQMLAGMQAGWSGSLEKLAELAQRSR